MKDVSPNVAAFDLFLAGYCGQKGFKRLSACSDSNSSIMMSTVKSTVRRVLPQREMGRERETVCVCLPYASLYTNSLIIGQKLQVYLEATRVQILVAQLSHMLGKYIKIIHFVFNCA